jgi:hypothetical protein
LRGFGHHRRIGTGDLYRNRVGLALVIGAAASFLGAPQQ